MDLVFFEMSDNLYYADQLGTISEQIDFLDSLHITEPRLVVDSSYNEVLLFTATYVTKYHLFSRLCVLKPSKEFTIRTFNHSKVLDIRRYLFDRGFRETITSVQFKKFKNDT